MKFLGKAKRVATPRFLALCLTGAFFGTIPPASAVTSFGDVDISPEPTPVGRSEHGYVEYRFVLVNRSPRDSHSVTLVMGDWEGGLRISRSVELAPSSTSQISLFQPPIPSYHQNVSIYLDGERRREPLFVQSVPHLVYGYGGYGTSRCVLVSRDVPLDFEKAFSPPAGRPSTRTYPEEGTFAKAETPVTSWSQNWLGYSRYDGIVVTGDDMRRMPPDVQTAVIRYIECGGSLLVLGSWPVPGGWRGWQKQEAGMNIRCMGFGECLLVPEGLAGSPTPEQLRRLSESWQQTQQTRPQSVGVEAANEMFPVVEKLGVSVRGMFILVLVFAVVIGPLNLLILSRKKRRIWLLWTVPAVSLFTCVAVSAYALFSEGVRAYFRTEGLTILDESSHRATTIGMTAFYSPLTPGGGLHFGYETELTPQVGWGYGYQRGRGRSLNWTNDQHLSGGWITARVPAHFIVRKSEARRERVAVRRNEDGSLSVVNGLGTKVLELWLAGRDGNIHHARNIPAGAQANLTLRATPVGETRSADLLRKAFASGWLEAVTRFSKFPEKHLRAGCYIALLDEAPFIEQGLRRANPRKCRSLVYGIMRGEANGNQSL